MLKFHLTSLASIAGGRWVHESGRRWVNGASWIEPFASPALESSIHVDRQGATVVVVRERARGSVSSDRSRPSDVLDDGTVAEWKPDRWKLDYFSLRINRGSVDASVGQWGSAPVYVTAAGNSLYGSWDFLDHRHHICAANLVDREIVGHLTLRSRYSARTLFSNVHTLTERTRMSWLPGNTPTIGYPDHAVHYHPRELREHAPIMDAYGSELRAAVDVRDLDIDDVMIEVSGGTDSATVAFAARTSFGVGELASYGLLVGGSAGAQQIMRRASLIGLASLSDVTVDAAQYSPLAPLAPGELVNPCEEPYGAAVTAAARRAGRAVVLTGIGGDELFALRPDERPAGISSVRPLPSFLSATAFELAQQLDLEPLEAPVSAIPETALRACRVRAPLFLRLGCWPIAPLCSPDMVRFGEWMPQAWRQGKRLPRTWLAEQGAPKEVAWPILRENFVPVMQNALRRHGIPQLRAMLADGSLLIDLGYLDADALTTMTRNAEVACGSGDVIDDQLHEVVSLERGLRSLLRC